MTRRTVHPKRIEELNFNELQKLKLVTEVKQLRKPFYLDPSFWTFIIAISAAYLSWQSGIFETKGEVLKLETLKLKQRRDTLNIQNQILLESNQKYKDTLNDIKRQIHLLNQQAKPILEEYQKTHPNEKLFP